MKKSVRYILSIFILISCEEQFQNIQSDIPLKLKDQAVLQFPGEITESGSAKINDVDLWEVRVENSAGAVVNFYWQKRNNLLYLIEGTDGPFDYHLQPTVGVLSFSSAQFLAYESYSEATLSSWKLQRANSGEAKWIYIFKLTEAEEPVVIDAVSGDFL